MMGPLGEAGGGSPASSGQGYGVSKPKYQSTGEVSNLKHYCKKPIGYIILIPVCFAKRIDSFLPPRRFFYFLIYFTYRVDTRTPQGDTRHETGYFIYLYNIYFILTAVK